MSKKWVMTALAFLFMTTTLMYQNCAGPAPESDVTINSTDGVVDSGYVEMTPSAAKAMILANETVCAANQSSVPSLPLIPNGTGYSAINYPNARGTLVAFIQGSGTTMLFHEGAGVGRVNSITNLLGNVMLCGFDVGTITGASQGNVVMDGGTVEMISGFQGNLTLIGATDFPTDISNYSGNIVIKTPSGQYKGRSYFE